MSRLQRKFFRSFLCLGVVPVLIATAVIIPSTYRLHRQDVALVAENLVNQQAAEISSFFEGIVNGLRIVVGYDDYAPPTLENQRFLLTGLRQSNPAIQDVSFVCTVAELCSVGTETARVQAGGGAAPLRDINGSAAFETGRQGRSFFGPVSFTKTGAVIQIAEPAVNRQNQVIGLVRAEVNLNSLRDLFSGTKLGQTGFLYLLDADNRFIAHSKLQLTGQPFSETGSVLRYRQETPQFHWTLGADWPLVEVDAIIQETMAKVAVVLLLVIVILFGVSFTVARQLLEPIQALILGAQAVGRGRLDQPVSVQTGDELEDLAGQFNKMTLDLKEVERLREAKLRAEYLEQALAKERELSAIKDKFLTTVSHQLNTPLSVMSYALQAIPTSPPALTGDTSLVSGQTAATPVAPELLAGIRASHRDLLENVQDTLFLSDIGFTYTPKRRESISLSDLITAEVARLAARANQRRVTVRIVAGQSFEIFGERLTLARALTNLIDNAITYSREGGEVVIELKNEDAGIIVSIRDTGIGIPADDQALIGREIFRAKNAVAGKNVGTGMGVLIARIVAEGHGGKLWFESRENAGTTFFLRLPLGSTVTGMAVPPTKSAVATSSSEPGNPLPSIA